MATLAYRLRIRNEADSSDDLIVTSLTGDLTTGEVVVASHDFDGYADTAALDADWTHHNPHALDATGGPDGSPALAVAMDGTFASSELASVKYREITGLTPGQAYTLTGQIKSDWPVGELQSFVADWPKPMLILSTDDAFPPAGFQFVPGTIASHNAWETVNTAPVFCPVGGVLYIACALDHQPFPGMGTLSAWFDNLDLTSVGIVPANAYIAEPPRGDGQTLNPVTGEVQTGGFTVAVIDAVTATDTRIVTAKLADEDGRSTLLSRRAYVEETDDLGVTWDVLMAGYVNSVRLVTAIRYEFTVGESRRIEQTTKVFEVIETDFDRASCIIGGPIIGDFGPLPDEGRPVFEVVEVDGDTVRLEWLHGQMFQPLAERGPPLRDNVRDYLNNLARHYLELGLLADAALRFYPDLTARLFALDTAPGVTSNPPAGFTADEADFTPLAIIPDSGIVDIINSLRGNLITNDEEVTLYWLASRGDQPSVGDRFKLAIFPRHISERNPLHWSGHPMDLATGLLTLRGESFNAASAASVTAELGDIALHLRLTGPMTLSEALEKLVYGPFGIGARTNAAGEREFFTTRRDFTPSVTTLDNDDLTSDEGVVWGVEEGSAVNKIVLKTENYSEQANRRDGDGPIDFLATGEVVHEAVPDESEVTVFGSQTVTYDLPGMILGVDLVEYVALLGAEMFDFVGRGAITTEINTRRGVTPALIGEVVTLDLAHLPTADPAQTPVSQRGTTPRLALVLRRTPTPAGPVLKLQDRGIAPTEQLAGEVTFTIIKSVADPRKIATVEITNGASFVDGEMIRVQMATGSSTPTSGSNAKLLDPAVDTLEFDLPAVDAGLKVWARMRVELTGFTPGEWSAFIGVQLDILQPPTALAGTFVGTTIPLSWVLGTNAADIPVEVLFRETGETEWLSAAFLPAGTMTYALTVPDPAVQYDLGVRHREAAPFNGVSAIATLLAQTSGAVVDTPVPPDPDDPPPPPFVPDASGGGSAGHLMLPFHATLTHGAVFRYPPPETAELEQYGRRRVDLSAYALVRGHIHVNLPLSTVARIAWQYVAAANSDPAEEDWLDLVETGTLEIAADVATEMPTTTAVRVLAFGARQDVVIRAVSTGGDDATQFGTRSMFLEFQGVTVNPDPEQGPEDPCQDTTIDFDGYDDTDAAEDDGWTNTPDASAGGEMHLDSVGGVDGTQAIRMDIAPTNFNYTSDQRISYTFTGLEPSTAYELAVQLKFSGAFTGETNSSFHSVGISFGGTAGRTLWFGGVILDSPSDARPYIGEFKGLGESDGGPALIANSDGSGNITLIVFFTSLLEGTDAAQSIWLDNIAITEVATGELVLPCTSGPTLPEDPLDSCPGCPPPVLPPSGPRKLYLWNYKRDAWGDFPAFNGACINVQPDDLVSALTEARSINFSLFLKIVGTGEEKKYGGVFTQAAWLEAANEFAGILDPEDWPELNEIQVMDEPNSVNHHGVAVQYSVVDGVLAKRTAELFPGVPIHIRTPATRFEATGVRPHYIQIVSIHYHTRFGNVADWMARERAAARRLGMAWNWGMNVLDGGDGSSGIPGAKAGNWRMSPAEIRALSIPMIADTESRSISIWGGNASPTLPSFLASAPYVAVFQDIVDALA